MTINGRMLRAKIVERGLNNRKLAEAIGVHPGTISNVLNGKTKPSYYVWKQINRELQLKADEVYEIFIAGFMSNKANN